MSSLNALRVSSRFARFDLRTDRSGSLSLAVLVIVTTVLATAAPILFARAAEDALPIMMYSVPPLQRDLEFTLDRRFEAEPGSPLARAASYGDHLQEQLPASIRGLIVGRVDSATTIDLPSPDLSANDYAAGLRLRVQDGADDHLTYVQGRAPAADGSNTFEIAISTELATWLSSDRLSIACPTCIARYDPSGARLGESGAPIPSAEVGDTIALRQESGETIQVEIVGVFEPVDPGADYWADPTLVHPIVTITSDWDFVDVRGAALMSSGDYPAVLDDLSSALSYSWRPLLDWRATNARSRATVAADVAALRVQYPFRGSTEGSDIPSVSTGLFAIIERYLRELAATQAAMTLALIGPACAAAGALGMIAATIARRRHEGVLLVRARGATDRQVLVARLLVAASIVAPAAAAAALGLTLAAGPEWTAGVIAIAATIALLVVALAIASTAQLLRESGGQLRQGRPGVWWGGPRSLVRDGLIIAVAIVGVIWIGQRGATRPSAVSVATVSESATIDPLLLLVPVLVALAGALIAWRAYVPLVRAGAAVATAHPGFVLVHALRGPARGAGALQVPLIVLVVTIAVGVFSTIVMLSLQREQDVVAWRFVGADYRVESATRQSLPLEMAGVPGVEAAADVVMRDGLLVVQSPFRALTLMGAALDADAYRRVVADTPADGLLPEALWTTSWTAESGLSLESPIPAVLVGEAARRTDLNVGDRFEMSAFGRATYFNVAGILPEFPGATSREGTVIVPLAAIEAAEPERTFVADQSFVRASPDLGEAMRAATIGSYGAPNIELVSRADVRAAMEADPLVRDTSIGFVLALLVSVAFSALVVAVAVVRDVAGRHGEIALLQALGTRPRQVHGVIVVEQGTVVLTAIAGGLALGCLMGAIAVPSLGLDRFVRPGQIVEATIDWSVVSSVAIVQAVLALLVMLVATLLARRHDPVPAMMRDA